MRFDRRHKDGFAYLKPTVHAKHPVIDNAAAVVSVIYITHNKKTT